VVISNGLNYTLQGVAVEDQSCDEQTHGMEVMSLILGLHPCLQQVLPKRLQGQAIYAAAVLIFVIEKMEETLISLLNFLVAYHFLTEQINSAHNLILASRLSNLVVVVATFINVEVTFNLPEFLPLLKGKFSSVEIDLVSTLTQIIFILQLLHFLMPIVKLVLMPLICPLSRWID
jgi:hypothetical protein